MMAENIPKAYCIAGNMVDRETTMHGSGISEEIASTLTAADRHAVASFDGSNITSPVNATNVDFGSPAVTLNTDPRSASVVIKTNEPMSTTGGANRMVEQQGEFPHKLSKGQSTNTHGDRLEGPTDSCNCNGGQIAGSLCAHDGRGFNGQDISDGKVILQRR